MTSCAASPLQEPSSADSARARIRRWSSACDAAALKAAEAPRPNPTRSMSSSSCSECSAKSLRRASSSRRRSPGEPAERSTPIARSSSACSASMRSWPTDGSVSGSSAFVSHAFSSNRVVVVTASRTFSSRTATVGPSGRRLTATRPGSTPACCSRRTSPRRPFSSALASPCSSTATGGADAAPASPHAHAPHAGAPHASGTAVVTASRVTFSALRATTRPSVSRTATRPSGTSTPGSTSTRMPFSSGSAATPLMVASAGATRASDASTARKAPGPAWRKAGVVHVVTSRPPASKITKP
mmetsp:Transcript_17359/g.56823  ORF Transcript_17359/g.56823 Transcript_17359/m.56823 type:complete len:299 (+) Transcript_17359:315-1211(+)